ncbi:MAG TPA: macro domain-containing protein [Gemmatimonadales bacterium]|jgi:O-acetyl-ADP-ribose deacetylase (regulator of RNase III)|nr:macro domain-containing protein [Gemmatimonadales bacterium]
MIEVVVDDLAFVKADAVLRPADERLDPAQGAAARLDQQAGPRFAQLRAVRVPLPVGAAVVTGGGDLGAPWVVHAVIQSREENVSADTVRRALTSAWQRAAQWHLMSVALPLVGAGAGQLPPEEAARLIRDTWTDPARPAEFPAALTVVVERERDRDEVAPVFARVRA